MTKEQFAELIGSTVNGIRPYIVRGYIIFNDGIIDPIASINAILASSQVKTAKRENELKAALNALEERKPLAVKHTGREITHQQLLNRHPNWQKLSKRHTPAPSPIRKAKGQGGAYVYSLDEVEVWEETYRLLRFSDYMAQRFIRSPKLQFNEVIA